MTTNYSIKARAKTLTKGNCLQFKVLMQQQPHEWRCLQRPLRRRRGEGCYVALVQAVRRGCFAVSPPEAFVVYIHNLMDPSLAGETLPLTSETPSSTPRAPKESILKTILLYSSSNIYRQFLGIFTAFIRPRLLSPELYGLWSLLGTIPNYTAYLQLGTRPAARYMIPSCRARGETERINAIKGGFYYGSALPNLVFALLLIAGSFWPGLELPESWGLRTMAAVVMLYWHYEYRVNILKGEQNFGWVTASNYVFTTASFILGVSLIWLFGIYGAYAALVGSLALTALYLRAKADEPRPHLFRWAIFSEMVRFGFPVLLFDLVQVALRSLDKFMVAGYMSQADLGYYGLGTMILGFIINIPGASREVIEPKLMQDFYRRPIEECLRDYFFKPLISTAFLVPLLIGAVLYGLPPLVHLLLPRYLQSIEPTQVLVIGSYFLALYYPARGIVVANNWQLRASLLMSLSVLVQAAAIRAAIALGWGLSGVAASCGLAYLCLDLILLLFLLRRYPVQFRGRSRRLFLPLLPFVIMCVLFFGLEIAFEQSGYHLLTESALKALCYYAVMGALLLLARKYRRHL